MFNLYSDNKKINYHNNIYIAVFQKKGRHIILKNKK